jgi:hypothetical protein
MPGERKGDLPEGDACAIVAHTNRSHAATLEFNVDTACSGIQRILDQLLDDGRRPFNHFAGGDLTDEFFG